MHILMVSHSAIKSIRTSCQSCMAHTHIRTHTIQAHTHTHKQNLYHTLKMPQEIFIADVCMYVSVPVFYCGYPIILVLLLVLLVLLLLLKPLYCSRSINSSLIRPLPVYINFMIMPIKRRQSDMEM